MMQNSAMCFYNNNGHLSDLANCLFYRINLPRTLKTQINCNVNIMSKSSLSIYPKSNISIFPFLRIQFIDARE